MSKIRDLERRIAAIEKHLGIELEPQLTKEDILKFDIRTLEYIFVGVDDEYLAGLMLSLTDDQIKVIENVLSAARKMRVKAEYLILKGSEKEFYGSWDWIIRKVIDLEDQGEIVLGMSPELKEYIAKLEATERLKNEG